MRYPRQAHMWVGLWIRWSAHFSTCQTLYLSSPLLGKAKPTFNLCHFPPIFFINPFQNLNILSVFLAPTTFHKQTACTHQPFYTSTIFQLNHILEINRLTLKKVYTSTSLQFDHFYTKTSAETDLLSHLLYSGTLATSGSEKSANKNRDENM